MTATDEFRAMLDERGVKYRTHGTTDRTWFEVGNISWFIIERENGNLTADAVFITPAQAIAATLGSGTVEKAAERIEVLSGFAREYLHRYGMLHEHGWRGRD